MEQLMRTHDHYLSPDRLREHARGYDAYVGPNVIWTYVSKLRHVWNWYATCARRCADSGSV